MSAKSKRENSWFTILLLVAAVAIWAYNESRPQEKIAKPERRASTVAKPTPSSSEGKYKGVEKLGGYEVYRNCKLVEARNNDGDSFKVALPNGKQAELRLYFVDTPESAFKSYHDGENNHRRITEQAAALGGISPQQAVNLGQAAKHYTLNLLGSQPFDIYTRWDSPFHDFRYHAFVAVKQADKSRWLEELLVEKGYVRIHTKPADLPDGTPAATHKARLKELESAAKRNGVGAWGL